MEMDLEERMENDLNMELCVIADCQVDTCLTASLLVFNLMKNVATFYSCYLFLGRPELHCLCILLVEIDGRASIPCTFKDPLHNLACGTVASLELFCAVCQLPSVSWVCGFFFLLSFCRSTSSSRFLTVSSWDA